ncbi:MAG: PTS transporter subunit EIIC [Erysipelotrichaceae bacterium]|nr:PTS transporter subunit EIIC [Erysipelotrichaceae bacterium]
MDKFADVMGRVGSWCGQNKYLSSIKNAFQDYMPATISGAVAVLWTSVLVNESTGLGQFFSPIMVLEPLNSIFNAINTATIGCIAIGVCMLVGVNIAQANGETGSYPAVLAFMMWFTVTPYSWSIADMAAYTPAIEGTMGAEKTTVTIGQLLEQVLNSGFIAEYNTFDATTSFSDVTTTFSLTDLGSFSAIQTSYMGATGLFTGLIIGILGMELYCALRKVDALKIKMPDQVPPGVAKAFEVTIPTCLALIIVGTVGWASMTFLGQDLNSLISTYVQEPLKVIIGGNIVAVVILYIIIMLFWCVGIHGNNMVGAVKSAIFEPMIIENMSVYAATNDTQQTPNVLNMSMMQGFAEWGGSGVTLGLIIAIFIFGKKEDTKAIATLSVVPGMFNINETMTFGIPLVLNPILDIPFILAPCACIILGYILTVIEFCPHYVVEVPWTCPPILFGFLGTGGNIMGAISQLLVMALATVIYIPFLLVYEKQDA